ncbi:MAG TPA: cytochrome c [Puia sp.]|uniref:cytochrome c n=1 Tax=Puia sp. TaxID=2045100 RepID=UPI002C620819|nr:cytochrome c [Puia sp.]HVU98427.1 cytochrome c [Puia sp.]
MRPELDLMERIEQYLNGELSPDDLAAFEAQLAGDAFLREAVQLQQDIRAGLERASLASAILGAKRRFYRRIGYRWGGFGLGLAVVGLVAVVFLTRHDRRMGIVPGVLTATHGEVYAIDTRRDTLLCTAHGAKIHLPAGSIDAGGAEPVRLEIKEAYTIADMLRYGLLTQSNGKPLSSGGMIDIRPVAGSSARIVRPIGVALPSLRMEDNMQLYKGVVDEKGKVNWTDPRPLGDSSGRLGIEDSSRRRAIADGKRLFETNCRSCHSIRAAVIGPALGYIYQRRPQKWINDFIRNNTPVLASGDCYARYIYNIFNKTPMNTFPNLSDRDIRNMMDYIANESQLIDSNRVPNYTRELDSCRRYNRLAGALEKNRETLIQANGPRTDIILHDDTSVQVIGDAPDSIVADTVAPSAMPAIVIPAERPSIYYQFTVEGFGWYNVDVLLKDLPGVVPSELRVRVTPPFASEVNVFLVLPGRKIFSEGGFLKDSKMEFGFLTEDGQIPLPWGEQAYVFATGEYRGKPVFAIRSFLTARQQNISLQPVPMTKEEITAAINHLDLNQLNIRVADSRNAVRIRAIDTALAAIARFKPLHCDCDCGELGGSDTVRIVARLIMPR